MPEKDPTTYSAITYAWVFALASWGGAVSFWRKVKNGDTRICNISELIGELITSAFAGIITFWLAESAGINPLVTAALVGISGHMGSRAIFAFEAWAESRFSAVAPRPPRLEANDEETAER